MKTKRQQAIQTIHAGTLAIAVLGLQMHETMGAAACKMLLVKTLQIANEVKAAREIVGQPTEAEDKFIEGIKSRLGEVEEALW